MPPRMIGLYALAIMEREGAVHGYLLARRIAERTGGAWRPGPGTVYPSLRTLVARGLARSRGVGRRREYRITPAGRAVLRRIRRRVAPTAPPAPDLTALWAEVAGAGDVGSFLQLRLHRTLEALSAVLAGSSTSGRASAGLARLRAGTTAELTAFLARTRRSGAAVRPRGRPAPRRGPR